MNHPIRNRRPAEFIGLILVPILLAVLPGCGPPMMQGDESASKSAEKVTTSSTLPNDRSKKMGETGNVVEALVATDRVLVIENGESPVSMKIAKYYMEKRKLTKLLQVRCPDASMETAKETLDFASFQTMIQKPIAEYLARDSSIDFIVLTKGIPIRLTGAPLGLSLTQPSLDSFLAANDYFQRPNSLSVVIDDSGYTGKCFVNNYWNSNERFSHAKFGGYLVTRLDGYTVESAMGLVDRSLASDLSKPSGKIFLDARSPIQSDLLSKVPLSPTLDGKPNMMVINEMGFNDWDADLIVAGGNLEKSGLPVELDQTEVFVGGKEGLMGYASWGSNDGKFIAENYKSIRFAAGGIAETAVSTSGRTFLPTSGGQSLIADLIDAGVTGAKGYSDEPFLPAIASPTILFDRYTRGWTLAESFYAASRFVGWEDIVLGDPLAAPYSAR